MKITTLFLDIGGVILTNGWGKSSRKLAAKQFDLDFKTMEERHHLTFDTYELGKITLQEYLQRIVFYQRRPFTLVQFREFMFSQSRPYSEMIALICQLKAKYHLKIAIVSNEGAELNAYRIKKFKLRSWVDFFISSCYVHFRKPDEEIFRIALNVSQTPRHQIVYLEDRPMFVSVAKNLGINSIEHIEYQSTVAKLADYGLRL